MGKDPIAKLGKAFAELDMIATTMHEIYGLAKIINSKLRADSAGFNNSVTLLHEDGTVLALRDAFALRHGDHYMVFTEHHGFFVYHVNDLAHICQDGGRVAIDAYGEAVFEAHHEPDTHS